MNTTITTEKKPLEWFEERVGQHIYRAPFMRSEKGRPYVGVKIRDKGHAKILFDIQRSDRPAYVDKPSEL